MYIPIYVHTPAPIKKMTGDKTDNNTETTVVIDEHEANNIKKDAYYLTYHKSRTDSFYLATQGK